MSNTYIAVYTLQAICVGVHLVLNIGYHTGMADDTVVLEDPAVLGGDHDGFMEILQCERFGVVVSILCFGNIFPDEVMRQMTIYTGGRSMVTGLLPGVELLPHYMTILTGFWIRA